MQVSLIDVDTRRGSFSTMNGPQMGNGGRPGQRDPNADRVIEAPSAAGMRGGAAGARE